MRKSKTKGIKAVNSPQVNKDRAFNIHFVVESFCIVFQKYILRQGFRLSLLNLFLIIHQISGSCSYNIVLIKRECKLLSLQIFMQRRKNSIPNVLSPNFDDVKQTGKSCAKCLHAAGNSSPASLFLSHLESPQRPSRMSSTAVEH